MCSLPLQCLLAILAAFLSQWCCTHAVFKADVGRPSLDKRLAFPIPYPAGKGTYLAVAIGNMV